MLSEHVLVHAASNGDLDISGPDANGAEISGGVEQSFIYSLPVGSIELEKCL